MWLRHSAQVTAPGVRMIVPGVRMMASGVSGMIALSLRVPLDCMAAPLDGGPHLKLLKWTLAFLSWNDSVARNQEKTGRHSLHVTSRKIRRSRQKNPQLNCIHLIKAKVPSTWGNYSNSTRLYDSFRNEWDLCDQLDPTSTPDGDWEEDFFDILDPIPDPLPPPPPAPPSLSSFLHDIRNYFGHHEVAASSDYTKGIECFVMHLWFHLGFHLAASTTRSIGGSMAFDSWVDKQKFSHVCNIVGDSGKDVNSISDMQQHVITCFVGYPVTLPTTQLSEIPSNHWDLAPGTPLSTLNAFIRVSYLNIPSQEQLYIIQPSPSRSLVPWKLVVPDTATAMMCLCHDWGSDISTIALELLKRELLSRHCNPWQFLLALSTHLVNFRHTRSDTSGPPPRWFMLTTSCMSSIITSSWRRIMHKLLFFMVGSYGG